ncbi:MAG: beta-glucosidase, partial [Frankiaceae bacterium]|nr:beta-glucosidase [Frankiaceae bacterium]
MTRTLVLSRPHRRLVSVLAAVALLSTTAAGMPTAGAAPAPAGQPVIGPPPLDENGCAVIQDALPKLSDWPRVESRIKTNPVDENRIAAILAKMTLAEKVGQMTQPEISAITPAEVKAYHIGSVLNGGGSWPGGNKHAAPQDWLALADAFWQASVTSNSASRIPVIWGIDAVHGNNNVYGATLFPHNIALGAAHDPCLIRAIGSATAEQIRATGQDWAFAPTLAVVRDDRWGRTYEGFSEDPRITRAYGYEAVKGLQGKQPRGIGEDGIIATAKHFMGDGGTDGGKDQGVNMSSEADMINIHAQGYYGALGAGAQTVMASFNSWTNADLGITEGKMHGSKYALTDILKQKMGFDGVVVSDWNGIGQVAGCSNASCPRAINAGLDVIMVPNDWKAFIANTIAQVGSGEIPLTRINDAVTRILRVKLRAGIFEEGKPSDRAHAGSAAALQAKELARAAVRKSLVLLKNNGNVLPLASSSKVLVVGKSADSMQNQTGGWTLSWQGTGNSNSDFPNGTTILSGLRAALGAANVTFSETAEGVDPSAYDAVIAVIGETPYAEGNGDIGKRSLEFGRMYPADRAVLDRVSGKGVPV